MAFCVAKPTRKASWTKCVAAGEKGVGECGFGMTVCGEVSEAVGRDWMAIAGPITIRSLFTGDATAR